MTGSRRHSHRERGLPHRFPGERLPTSPALEISRTDVAATIAALIKRGMANETLQLSAGSTPVADAVANLA